MKAINVNKTLLVMTSFLMFACNQEASSKSSSSVNVSSSVSSSDKKNGDQKDKEDVLSSYSVNHHSVKVSMTNKGNPSKGGKNIKELASVIVNVDFVTVNGNKDVVLAENVGQIDLMNLSNGVLVDLGEYDANLKDKIKQVRLMLKLDGNFVQYSNGDFCELQIPSQYQSGLKINFPEFEVEEGFKYSIVIDFDPYKSIVQQGNGGCLLKPVIHLAELTKVQEDEVNNDGQANEDSDEDVVDDGSSNDNGGVVDDGSSNDNGGVVDDGSSNDNGGVVDDGSSNDNGGVVDDGSSNDNGGVVDDGSSNDNGGVVDDGSSNDNGGIVDDGSSNDNGGVVDDGSSNDNGGVVDDGSSNDNGGVIDDGSTDQRADCSSINLYDPSSWPEDINWSDYSHCY